MGSAVIVTSCWPAYLMLEVRDTRMRITYVSQLVATGSLIAIGQHAFQFLNVSARGVKLLL